MMNLKIIEGFFLRNSELIIVEKMSKKVEGVKMTRNQWHLNAKEKWDENAASWHSKSISNWHEGSRKDIVPFIKLHIPKGSKIADLGCGDGYGSFRLWEEGYSVTGIDLSQKMIDLARKQEKERLKFVQGDLSNIPFDEESFDGAMAINSLEWTSDPLHSLEEIRRIVKLKGLVCIGILGPTAHPRKNAFPRLRREEVICNTMMPWELEELVVQNGWEKIDEHWVYKKGVKPSLTESLSNELKQSLTFMTLFIFQRIQ